MFNNKTILITGGTGSFGNTCTKIILDKYTPKSLRIFSRDEYKQWVMTEKFKNHKYFNRLRFFIGDVRDKARVKRALENADIVIHAAALKQIPTAEYNPTECIQTNIIGSQNVIEASLDNNVKKVIALSSDKATAPTNLYGATKLCAEKLFIAANNIRGKRKISFCVVRYGNVIGSRGSVIPLFIKQLKNNTITITHPDMTRFNITLDDAVNLVIYALKNGVGGEIFIPKLPSYKITDLAKAIAPKAKIIYIGIRPGEKLHEEMLTATDSVSTIETKNHYVIIPPESKYASYTNYATLKKTIKKLKGKKVSEGFTYNSGENNVWLKTNNLKKLIKKEFPNLSF